MTSWPRVESIPVGRVSATTRRLGPGLAAALAGWLVTVSPPAHAAVEHLSVKTARPYGYVIGDVIEHEVSLALDPGFELDRTSVPEPGRVTRWLSLNEASHVGERRNGGSRHTIRLRFQVVNAAQSVTPAGTPPLRLRVVGPEGDFPVIVPAWAFTVSPILPAGERPAGRPPDLRPALPPGPITTDMRMVRVTALGALALGLVALFAGRHLAERTGRRARRHFDRAYRRIRHRMRGPASSGAYPDALVEMHAAFNATAGHAVFEHDLARFFVEHPRFEPLRAPIAALFTESSAMFYGDGPTPAARDGGLNRVRDLCRACRDVERSA